MSKKLNRYTMKYPHYLEWEKRIWVMQEGDLVRERESGELYEVKQVLKSYRTTPKLVVETTEKIIYQ